MRNRQIRRRWVGVAVLALVVAACGGDGDAALVASLEDRDPLVVVDGELDGVGAQDTESVLMEFAQCMRDEGIDWPDPTVDADGNVRIQRPSFDGGLPDGIAEAREACGPLLEGIVQQFRQRDQTERQDRLVEFASCMRDNGFDMPDPDLSAIGQGPAGGGPGVFGDLERDAPDFAAAQEACADILAGFGPGAGRPATGGG